MRRISLLLVALLLVLALAAQAFAANEFPEGIVGTVSISDTEAIVGGTPTITGSGFAPGTVLTVIWQTYEGGWNLEYKDGEYTGNFLGRKLEKVDRPIGTVKVKEDGTFAKQLEIPEGYGGTHNIYVRKGDHNLNRVGIFIKPHTTMSPNSGPLGTNITITMTGLSAAHNIEGWYALIYDNKVTGLMTGVNTKGTATTTIPAVGKVGKHIIELQIASFGEAYLPLGSSPYGYMPVPRFTFNVTDGDPVLPPPIADQAIRTIAAKAPQGDRPAIWFDYAKAPVGTPVTIHGKGFAPNVDVRFELLTMIGSRVTPSGFAPVSNVIAEAKSDAQGRIEQPYTYPDTHGGSHRITAFVGDKEVARTYIDVARTGLPLKTAEGPVGTQINLHVKGIGWTQTENIFGVVIDNSFIGYACGFSTNGDVQVPITLTGEPGWHFIDLYPSFYRNKKYADAEEQPFLYRKAILSWDDHPNGFHLRYAYKVTE